MREGGGKTRDPYAIERDPGRRKRHQSRGMGLTIQQGDGNVSNPVYEFFMEKYLRVIILRVRWGEKLRRV